MRVFLLSIYLLFFSFTTFGSTEADSMKRVLNSGSLSGEERFNTLVALGRAHFNVSLDSALAYGFKAQEYALESKSPQLIAEASKLVGTIYYYQNKYPEALGYFQQALKINRELDNVDKLPACYSNLGLVYNHMGYYDEALKAHLQQLSYNEELNNKRGIAISNWHIGNVYNNMDEYDKALKYNEDAKTIAEQIGDTNAIGTSLINIGVANQSLKNYEIAKENFSRALAIKQKYSDERNIASIYLNLGEIYLDEKKFEMAQDYFNLGLKLNVSMNDRRGITVSLLNLGDVFLRIEEYEKSFWYFEQALDLARELEIQKLEMQIYELMSEWYEKKGDFKNALLYFKKHASLSDTLLDIEKSRQIRDLQIVYDVEKKDKEILEQSVSIQVYKSRQLYFLLALVLILGVAFIFYYRYRLKRRVNRELEIRIAEALHKQQEQQQIIVHQASLTSLGELAAGIAHEIKQPLQNISLSNESLDMENREEEPDRDFIAKTVKDIYEDIKRIKFIINEISNFSRGQQEEMCEPFSVNTRIQNAFSLARTRFSNRRIDVKFELDEQLPDIEGNPYKFEQVVVNFFNNAKDAIEERAEKSDKEFSKWMLVKSFSEGDRVVVEVSDNGIGVPDDIKTNIFLPFFTTKSVGKGTGLGLSISLGIIKEMNGFIELESEPNERTTMRVKIPVSRKWK
jgi:signal transduction histidine kinase